jgi:BirA family biotin operon repressor/biotin-[acetyl-CoA-carboxylase] ligase
LNTPPPFLEADQLLASTFVKHIEFHETLGSTNDRAKELAGNANVVLPALVVARLQTAGKGRGQHTWWSTDGSLTFSVLIDSAATGIASFLWPQLSLATAVAVCDALERELDVTGLSTPSVNPKSEIRNPKLGLGIKWPNDVLLAGRKVAGILIESPGGVAPAKGRIIMGVGINVNNSWRGAPRDAGAGGTALCDATGRKHDLQVLLSKLLSAIARRVNQLQRQDAELVSAWQKLDILAGQNIEFQNNAQDLSGKCLKIADDGALVIKTLAGPRRLYSGSIRAVS